MKKIVRLSALVASVALLAGLSGCSSRELDTDQYPSGEVHLASYGPNPVMRGATLRFFGANLDKVTEVQVPGVAPITAIEVVKSGSPSEIRVQLPVDGPEVGLVTLKTSDGKVLTTQTELEYSEPIVFDSFSAKEVNYPGDVVTVKGDYMNLVTRVIFEGGESAEIIPGDRYTASVVIPSSAITGKIVLTDDGEIANLLYSEKDLVIGDPTVSSLRAPVCKPFQPVTISGKYLNMIDYVLFAEGVEVEDFEVSEDGTTLSVEIPETAATGDVLAVSYAGKEFKAGSLDMVVPTGLSAEPQPVKAGQELTVSGKDLDIVTAVDLPNAGGVSFSYASGNIVLTVPAAAQEGDMVLGMANGDEVSVAYTLVHPAVTQVSPTELMAGETITVSGKDLDLITEVTLGGKPVEFTADENAVVITTVNTSVSGKIVLGLANGETLEPEDVITLSYDSFIIVNQIPSMARVGDIVTLKGENFLMIENIYIGEAKVDHYMVRTDNEISFLMPENFPKTYDVKFQLLSGEEEICPSPMEVRLPLIVKTIWEGSQLVDWNNPPVAGAAGAMTALSWGGYDWSKVEPGTVMNIYYTLYEGSDYWQMRVSNGSWGALPDTQDPYNLSEGSSILSVEMTEAMLSELVASGGLVLTGAFYTVTKVDLVNEPAGALEPVKATDIVLVDWNVHGGHNGYWDQPDGWGGVTTELVDRGDGDLYLRIKEDSVDQKWTVCCNHQSNYTENVPAWVIEDASQYVLKVDVLLEEGASAAGMTFNPVLGDNWPGGRDAGLFPATTGGEWITVTIDLGLTGKWDLSSGTNGFMAAGVPAGLCLDNFRFSLR